MFITNLFMNTNVSKLFVIKCHGEIKCLCRYFDLHKVPKVGKSYSKEKIYMYTWNGLNATYFVSSDVSTNVQSKMQLQCTLQKMYLNGGTRSKLSKL